MSEKSQLLSNFLWRFMERWGAKGITLIVSIILARLLEPEAYGLLSLVTVITALLQVFVDSGLGIALIQEKEIDDVDYSSVFWFNIVICIFLYLLMFFGAPLIAVFYNNTELIPVIRVVSLVLIISGVKNVQQAYVSRNLMFKKFFFSTLGGTISAAIVGILMAVQGFGVWALVTQYLLNTLIDTIVLWITVKWRPKFVFSFSRFKSLFSYGWKMLISSLIDTTYQELRSLIIGKFYSSNDLAFYTKGSEYPKYAVSNINDAMNSVLLPVLSKRQDDKVAVKSASRRVIRLTSYVIWPLMLGLCAVSDNFIIALLGEKWLPASIYLKILCIGQAFQPIQTTNLSVIKALGRSDLHLKLEIIKKSIAILIVILSSIMNVTMIAVGSVVYAIIATIINCYPNKKLINYGYFEQFFDLLPFIGISAFMGVVVYLIGLIQMPVYLNLSIQVIVGGVVYFLISKLFKIDTLDECINTVKVILNN